MKAMNPLNKNIFRGLFIFLMMSVFSCEEINPNEDLKPLEITDVDADAGTWSLIPGGPMTSIDQIPLAAPSLVTSDSYSAELATIKDAQSKLTDSQRASIAYWNSGGVLRWNQIMRGLVAKYSLAPAPRDDGSYIFPDPENPFADPAFPFSSPPYSARAYSYVSAAQYEALKATWHYKFLPSHTRPAPFKNDPSIKLMVGANELNDHAYPSEDAVLSGVTAELLKLLFPASVEEITLKAAEQRNAALWSGKASPSDILAGLNFGKSVAALFTTRARNDEMSKAIGVKAQWDALADSAKAHLAKVDPGRDLSKEIFWQSLDAPSRPPMLPFFGNVKGWLMSPAQFAVERTALGPPPSTSSEKMRTELAEVKSMVDEVDRERLRIVHFWADGGGTYTPPGHWNDIAAEYISNANFSEVRAARAFALLNMAMHDAAVGCWGVKYYWFNPRPSQLDPSIKTLTGLPNFPAYTSGHSTFSAAASTVLSRMFPEQADLFDAYKEEASISRLYGGIHYKSDLEKGKAHGVAIAGYTVAFGQTDGCGF
jgi:PAP2 superfamily